MHIVPHKTNLPVQYNVTPKYAIVDVQIDRGMEVLTVSIERCEKIWFLWLPTDENLQELGQRMGITDVQMTGSKLIDGIIAFTDSTEALYIPSVWLHSTVIFTGGFLAGLSLSWLDILQMSSSIPTSDCSPYVIGCFANSSMSGQQKGSGSIFRRARSGKSSWLKTLDKHQALDILSHESI